MKALLKAIVGILGASGGLLGKSWAVLKAILGILETSGGDLRGVKGVSQAVLGFLEATWRSLRPALDASWVSMEAILDGLGGHLGGYGKFVAATKSSWGRLGGHVEPR